MKHLKDNNISATGTVRQNRMNNCPIKSDSEMKKEPRGTFDYCFDNKHHIFAVTWKDSSCVKMLSNYQGFQPLQTVKRWSRIEKSSLPFHSLYVCNSIINTWAVWTSWTGLSINFEQK